MKGILVAFVFGMAIISATMGLIGKMVSFGIYDKDDLTDTRQHVQTQIIKFASSVGLSKFEQYRMTNDKFKNQEIVLYLMALVSALPVFLLVPLVFVQRKTKRNVALGINSLGMAIGAILIPVSIVFAALMFLILISLSNMYIKKQQLKYSL